MFIRRTTCRLMPGTDQPGFEREMGDSIRPHEIKELISTAHVPNDDGS